MSKGDETNARERGRGGGRNGIVGSVKIKIGRSCETWQRGDDRQSSFADRAVEVGQRQPTHGGPRGSVSPPKSTPGVGLIAQVRWVSSSIGSAKLAEPGSVFVGGGRGETGKEVGIAVGNTFTVLESVSGGLYILQPALGTRIFSPMFARLLGALWSERMENGGIRGGV